MHSIKHKIILVQVLFASVFCLPAHAEDGYELWLRYAPLKDARQKGQVERIFEQISIKNSTETFLAIKAELRKAAEGMINQEATFRSDFSSITSLVIGTPNDFANLNTVEIKNQMSSLGDEGFLIRYVNHDKNKLAVISNNPIGCLYGTFHLLRLLQSGGVEGQLPILNAPKITNRILNHWDNLDRTVERGYAGFSIWDWHRLPGYIDQRYIDYARANASIGINGTVLTNVNANALVLTASYIQKIKALADVFRPYGLKVYLTARFSAPIEIGGLDTADPMDDKVREWWNSKANEIYASIPDFGGFLVKANSEGQPGPQNYNRSHADGANMLADAVAPHGGIVMWRAFVYSHEAPEDRAKQANNEFEPLDGEFNDNVFIQVKNGAIDFQPREPFHPLFGAMKNTKLALEVQITMEYLGQGTSLVYLAPLFKECLDAQTFRPSKQSTVSSIVDGSDFNQGTSVMAGVSNIGNDRNWTGHIFGQANWYAYGRLAWDHQLSSLQIAEEWVSMTFGNEYETREVISGMMMDSREAFVNYSTPLGLHHIMGWDHHYGPGPWVVGARPDWSAPYYHQADSSGIGFDRTSSGSDALSQYAFEIEHAWSDPKSCPEKYLLWFHHLPWTYQLKSGNALWDELCYKYDLGVKEFGVIKAKWQKLENKIDHERYHQVAMLLDIQEKEAKWWRNSCLLYFQTFSQMDFPASIEKPAGELDYYKSLRFPYAPGIRPTW